MLALRLPSTRDLDGELDPLGGRDGSLDLPLHQDPLAVDLRVHGAGRRNGELGIAHHEVTVDATVDEEVLAAFDFAADDSERVADTSHV